MSKLIDCPVCGATNVPVRNDAEVCSPKCRLIKWRKKQKDKFDSMVKQLESE